MKEQMNQGVSRKECEALVKGEILKGDWRKELKRLARAHLALLDEYENLRLDKKRLDWLESRLLDHWNPESNSLGLILSPDRNVRKTIDAAISENAANARVAVSKESLPTEIGRAESTARYEAGDLPLASSEVEGAQDSSVSGAGQ